MVPSLMQSVQYSFTRGVNVPMYAFSRFSLPEQPAESCYYTDWGECDEYSRKKCQKKKMRTAYGSDDTVIFMCCRSRSCFHSACRSKGSARELHRIERGIISGVYPTYRSSGFNAQCKTALAEAVSIQEHAM